MNVPNRKSHFALARASGRCVSPVRSRFVCTLCATRNKPGVSVSANLLTASLNHANSPTATATFGEEPNLFRLGGLADWLGRSPYSRTPTSSRPSAEVPTPLSASGVIGVRKKLAILAAARMDAKAAKLRADLPTETVAAHK